MTESGLPSEQLFGEFPVPTYDEWRAEVDCLLKGAPFERLQTTTPEGLTLQPLYRAEDLADVEPCASLPGVAPFIRGAQPVRDPQRPWDIAQEISAATPAESNAILRQELAGGATAVNIRLDDAARAGMDPDAAEPSAVGRGGVSMSCVRDLSDVLSGVDPVNTSITIHCGSSGVFALSALITLTEARNVPRHALHGAIAADPLCEWAGAGSLPWELDAAFDDLAACTAWAARHAPQLGTVWVHGELFGDGGGHAVHELAFTLAAAIDYLRALEARGIAAAIAAPHMRFSFALGSRFFTETAKLRAARLLWNRVLEACGVEGNARRMRVHARTARSNKTACDPHVNLLRTTTEILSGVAGGAESLHADPFDAATNRADEFSRRIARNTQHIIRYEAHLDAVADPAGGSYYVEHLTAELARTAWTLLQTVERAGGFAAALRSGFVQTELAQTAAAQAAAAATGRHKIVGTNVYPDPDEVAAAERTMSGDALQRRQIAHIAQVRAARPDTELATAMRDLAAAEPRGNRLVEAAIIAAARGATLGEMTRARQSLRGSSERIAAIPLRRIAEPFEQLRRAVEARGRIPVFIAGIGAAARYMPRLDFAAAFFETGGFAVERSADCDTPEQAAEAAIRANAQVVVICGRDEDYPAAVSPIAQTIKRKAPTAIIVLAGLPSGELADSFRAAGVNEFIHQRSDRLQVLTAIAGNSGVRV